VLDSQVFKPDNALSCDPSTHEKGAFLMPTGVHAVSVVDAIAADLREQVLVGRAAPGSPLTEQDVAQRYDVARPTAKAAIEALVFEGLLERRTHKTARVVQLGPDDVRDIYRSRANLESQVLRELALTRAVPAQARAANAEILAMDDASALDVVGPDMRFHTALIDALGSPRTSRMYRSLVSEVTLCMAQVQGRQLLTTKLISGEHERMLELIEAGDGDGAAALLADHLGRARERLVEQLGGVPGPEASLSSPWE
jgi:DNA-binding GntR family transcriptional regulator